MSLPQQATNLHEQEIIDKFYSRIEFRDNSDCWWWTGPKTPSGYGCFAPKHKVMYSTHRLAWEINKGPIPTGMHICHICDNPPCVNPDHLFIGTNQDNVNDRVAKGRQQRGQSHGQSILTEDHITQIRALVHYGVKQTTLARMFGVKRSTVNEAVLYHTWRHIP